MRAIIWLVVCVFLAKDAKRRAGNAVAGFKKSAQHFQEVAKGYREADESEKRILRRIAYAIGLFFLGSMLIVGNIERMDRLAADKTKKAKEIEATPSAYFDWNKLNTAEFATKLNKTTSGK
jgi:hypothetical protein